MGYKSKRAKATDIPRKVKEKVWQRDDTRCVSCGSPYAMPNAHFVPRSRGGLGIEENVVTLCRTCHNTMDNGYGERQQEIRERCREYLQSRYKNWNEEKLVYRKWNILGRQ